MKKSLILVTFLLTSVNMKAVPTTGDNTEEVELSVEIVDPTVNDQTTIL